MVTTEVLLYMVIAMFCILGLFASRYNANEYFERTKKIPYGWIFCGILNLICVIINVVKALIILG
jgi:hypothetical protein